MSAGSNMDPEKQTLVQFHQYVDLPAELRIKIIQEFIADLRKELRSSTRAERLFPFGKFAPFAVIHSEWQYEFEAEQELFGSLCLSTSDLSAFHLMTNQHRRDSLSKLTLRVNVNNTAVEFNGQMRHARRDRAVASRACGFIVNSVVTILESVAHATYTEPQGTRAGLELHIQIIIPGDKEHFHLRHALSPDDGIDCDFSQLPLLHTIRKFSQQRLRSSQAYALRYPKMFFLTPSSLLTLVRRMPNLEQAVGGTSVRALIFDFSAPQMNSFPRLKTLTIPSVSSRITGRTLARWTLCWGDTIENLETCSTVVPTFLRAFIKHDNASESIAWPKLQVLKVRGDSYSGPPSTSAGVLAASNGPMETLSAMAVALAWLPSIKDVTVKLRLMVGVDDVFIVVIRLNLCSGSSNLTISQPVWQEPRGVLGYAFWSGSSESGDLSFKDHLQDVAAEVQAAVRMHRRRDLEILWPETLEGLNYHERSRAVVHEGTPRRRSHARLAYFGLGEVAEDRGGGEVVTSQQQVLAQDAVNLG